MNPRIIDRSFDHGIPPFAIFTGYKSRLWVPDTSTDAR